MNDKASAATQDLPVRVIPCGPAVNESERRAVERVKASLIGDRDDGQWLILTNLAFSASHRLQADEIDIVAIGPPGVRVIEVKHWTAAWVRGHDDIVAQEADRVTAKARKIGTTLRARLPNLPHVFGVFLVTEAAAKVERLPEEIRGVRFHTLKTCRQAVGAGAPAVLSLQEIRFAARRLEPRSEVSVTGELRRVAGYAHLQLQSPAAERFHRVYRAVHATRQERVVLHFYDWSASEEPSAAAKAEREFQALHRLQRYAWAPRIIDSFQASPGYAGENAFFTIADPAAPSIAERAADESWDTGARLSFARSAVRAVRDLHGAGGDEPMVHRCLTARSILVRHDNSPILTDFQHARIPAEITVSSPAEGRTWDTATAPEVRAQGRGAADRRSDVYSLCASLQALFTEREDDASRAAAAVLALGRAEEPNRRSTLDELEHSLSTQLGESPPATPPPPARFWTEDQVVPFDGHYYRIVGRLGSGGVGTAFKVVEIDRKTGEELGTYVGKVIHDRENGERVLYAHNLVRSHLRHAALSVVYQVASEWRDNAFAALMTWIEGEPLSEYAGLLRELAEDQGDQSEEALAIRWLRVACEALGELHRNGLVHGDVSPRNLILSGGDVVLTDFDCVGKVGEVATAPGTVMYSSPSRVDHHPATPSDDFFALSASMFHVLFARDPFSYEGARDKARGVNWNGIERADYPVLAPFIDRATAADRQRRLTDAAAAMRELQAAPASSNESSPKQSGAAAGDGSPPPPVARTERSENEVLWLRDLLQSYPGSRWGNRETRGLDSDFAERTYVETRLERALFDDLQEGSVSLVVLCGNAGDGKTALLQHLAARFGLGDHLSEQRIVEGQTAAGLTVRMNLDGSAAWGGRSSTVLLDHFLAPFQNGRPRTNLAHLLAINDGRLLEWIEDYNERLGETPLTRELSRCLEDAGGEPASYIRFVSLNQRSLVGGVTADGKAIDTGFLDSLVDALYGGARAEEIWTPCRTCSAQERCQVFRAARNFAPLPVAEDENERQRARERLFDALQAVHLRGEVQITVRELRAALVYILFGVHFCSDYHAGRPGAAVPYWNRAFDPASTDRQGEVLREIVYFDPALEAHPHIDRALLHPPDTATQTEVRRWDASERTMERRARLASERRRAYFEWPDALGLAQGSHLRSFRDLATMDDDGRAELAQRLCRGISHLEALPLQASERSGVPLRIAPRTPTETTFWVEKRAADFRLEVELPRAADVDRLHRHVLLIYRYEGGREETLRIGAELWYLLLELEAGYQLGDAATEDTFAHLSIFVQRLVQEDERRMMAWSPMAEETIYNVSAELIEGAADARQRLVITPQHPGAGHGE